MLPDTNEQTAVMVGERIREGIEAEPIPTRAGPMELTISLGAHAAVPGPDDNSESFLERADQALYRSKQEGRNRVTLYRDQVLQKG